MIKYTDEELIAELKRCYGEDAEFHDGQKEAVKAVLDGQRTLVVQKTGWGKSLVYFMSGKIIREQTSKISLIISPLLVLMNNQIDAAMKLDLNVETINSENKSEWTTVMGRVMEDDVDALIVSPERLANEEFRKWLREDVADKIGLFVVDEAHCISDWGHDFRPDYRRIVDLIKLLPANVPVLATTATANDRVVNDIKSQLGDDIVISRGELIRESIAIQTIHLNSRAEKLSWLEKHVNELPGSGVVYALTVNDCNLVAKWLNTKGISCKPYFADLPDDVKHDTIRSFMNNEIKVLSATVAFGMGFDKPDIGFVIHFQRPGNVVGYYQQIGRAGRQIPEAYAILLYGEEDDLINDYFIRTAFPTEDMMNTIVETVESHPGIKMNSIQRYVNMKQAQISKSVKYLDVNGDIYAEKSGYYKALRPWAPDLERCRKVTDIRRKELASMSEFSTTSQCYMEYIAKELDDSHACPCGKCSNCLGRELYDSKITPEEIAEAQQFIRDDFHTIPPRRQWPDRECSDSNKIKIEAEYLLEEGKVLSNYGDAGWGKEVAIDKYQNGSFREELVTASYNLLKDFIEEQDIKTVTYIPSLRRPDLVKDFAERLAEKLGLECFTALEKIVDAEPQKTLNNSYNQWKNANDSFGVVEVRSENILLVDDMVDSRWTFTCCGYKLRRAGSGKIYPYALSNSASGGSEGA